MDPLRVISIGIALALVFSPLAYCEMKTAQSRYKAQEVCAESGGDWRVNSCRIVQ